MRRRMLGIVIQAATTIVAWVVATLAWHVWIGAASSSRDGAFTFYTPYTRETLVAIGAGFVVAVGAGVVVRRGVSG